MLEYLNEEIKNALNYIRFDLLYEIRIRVNFPVKVKYDGVYRYLSRVGITNKPELAIVPNEEDVAEIVLKGGQHSIYSVENQIKRGFITTKNGERIGLAGEFVYEGKNTLTIRNISSLCIRIPHEIIGCAEKIFQLCDMKKGGSLIVLSPPGQGKTTILRDLARILTENLRKNVLICDERGEIALQKPYMGCDVLSYGIKEDSFEVGMRRGIRSRNPFDKTGGEKRYFRDSISALLSI